jgi:hypothetical protein
MDLSNKCLPNMHPTSHLKKIDLARCWWLTHVILATQEAGRDQEDHGSKPAQANSLWDPISKKIHHKKRAGGVA